MVDKVLADRFANVIAKGDQLMTEHRVQGSRSSHIKPDRFAEWRTQSITLLSTVFGAAHPYTLEFEKVTEAKNRVPDSWNALGGAGVLKGAAEDFARGYIWTFRERV